MNALEVGLAAGLLLGTGLMLSQIRHISPGKIKQGEAYLSSVTQASAALQFRVAARGVTVPPYATDVAAEVLSRTGLEYQAEPVRAQTSATDTLDRRVPDWRAVDAALIKPDPQRSADYARLDAQLRTLEPKLTRLHARSGRAQLERTLGCAPFPPAEQRAKRYLSALGRS